ncbi:MAG: MFS transporter [Actinomycetota bacterium]|uniref:Major facilitator superfamily (MFS) profile domain-containing protein n=1 Tax=marine metagenome TaxID=408172 RepID=A0A381Q2M3_9ZZZZ|nr:MFS transporter [Actinomycetota bacterium]|tara:strand:+ start:781 stop:2082 length:1302 start_codon:yes stop_codon:yes gene_type:complete
MNEATDHFDTPRAWAVAIGASIANGVAFGVLYTFGAFVTTMAEDFNSSLGPTSIVFGLSMFLFFGTGAISGRWADAHGPRPLLIVGGALFCGGLVATSFVTAIWQGYIAYGVGCGVGGGIFCSPLFSTVATFFVKYRALAQGVAATGSGVGTLLLVPLSKSLIEAEGWRNSYRILAIIAAIAFIIGLVLVRRSPSQAPGGPDGHVRRVMRTREFKTISTAFGLMSMALLGAFAFVIKFAEDDGVSPSKAALLMSVVGASSILGRLLLTAVAGKLGSVRLLQIALVAQPIAYFFWVIANGRYYLLVIFAALLGLTYGGFVALSGDVVAFYFGLTGIGAVTGMLFLCSGFGSLVGPPIVGFLADLSTIRILPVGAVFAMALLGAIVLLTIPTKPVEFGITQPPSSSPGPAIKSSDTLSPKETAGLRPTVFDLEPV